MQERDRLVKHLTLARRSLGPRVGVAMPVERSALWDIIDALALSWRLVWCAERQEYLYPTFSTTFSGADGEYVGLCPEFPSLSHLAPSPEDAEEGIRQLVYSLCAAASATDGS